MAKNRPDTTTHTKVTLTRDYVEHGQRLEAGKTYYVPRGHARHLRQLGYAVAAAQNAPYETGPAPVTAPSTHPDSTRTAAAVPDQTAPDPTPEATPGDSNESQED